MAVHTTACPRNCYSTCSMRVEVESGRIRRIEVHPDNEAATGGVCLKGLSYVERQVSDQRLLTPLRRVAGGDRFEPVSWEAALGAIAEAFGRARDRHGPQSLLYYSGSGTKGLLNGLGLGFWRLFGGCTTTYGDLCWPAGLEATRLTLGANKHNAPWDLRNARLVILWGKNSAETNIHQMTHVERAVEAGARLVVIDPRRTETSERADLSVRPQPGTDGALALGLAHLLIEAGSLDRSFVERHVLGFDAFRERCRAFPPERVASITGVPESTVRTLAEWIGGVAPMTLCAGYGMQRYTNSGQTMRALLALVVITGNLGRPGAGWQFANLQTDVFGGLPDPIAFYPPERPDGEVRVSISTARLGSDLIAARDPEVKVAWIERGNPVAQNPDSGRVQEALRRLDFRVVVDQFLTDTAREADVVLPAKTLFEQSDVIGAYWHPYLQLKQKVCEPPGEVRPESEIYRALAPRLGLDVGAVSELLPEPGDAGVEAWLERRLAPFPGLDLERLREGPVLAPGSEEIAFADGRFPTPSGKIELDSEEAARRWGIDRLPDYEPSAEHVPSESRHPLWLMTPNTKNRIHSQFNNLAMIRRVSDRPRVRIHPEDARERGVGHGDRVAVFNDRGRLELDASLDGGLLRGCVEVTNGWWHSDGGCANVCSLGRETDIGHGAAFHDNRVEVERLG